MAAAIVAARLAHPGSPQAPEVRAWCAPNQVELVVLPTCASWLNWIEAEFAAVRYFAIGVVKAHRDSSAAH